MKAVLGIFIALFVCSPLLADDLHEAMIAYVRTTHPDINTWDIEPNEKSVVGKLFPRLKYTWTKAEYQYLLEGVSAKTIAKYPRFVQALTDQPPSEERLRFITRHLTRNEKEWPSQSPVLLPALVEEMVVLGKYPSGDPSIKYSIAMNALLRNCPPEKLNATLTRLLMNPELPASLAAQYAAMLHDIVYNQHQMRRDGRAPIPYIVDATAYERRLRESINEAISPPFQQGDLEALQRSLAEARARAGNASTSAGRAADLVKVLSAPLTPPPPRETSAANGCRGWGALNKKTVIDAGIATVVAGLVVSNVWRRINKPAPPPAEKPAPPRVPVALGEKAR